jgi:hypothetical protein
MQLDTVSIGYATPPTPPSITGFSVSGGVATIDFTSDNASDSAVDFTLLSSETLGGFTADPAANPVSGSEGNFQVTVPFVGPKRFYKVEK